YPAGTPVKVIGVWKVNQEYLILKEERDELGCPAYNLGRAIAVNMKTAYIDAKQIVASKKAEREEQQRKQANENAQAENDESTDEVEFGPIGASFIRLLRREEREEEEGLSSLLI